jgi:hypothetical protein
MLYAQGLKIHSTARRVVAKSPPVEDHTAIEVGRLVEDVRRTLDCDLRMAKRSASRLAALLTAFASLMFGYDTVVISGALLFIRDVMILPAAPRQLSSAPTTISPKPQISDGLATHGTFVDL